MRKMNKVYVVKLTLKVDDSRKEDDQSDEEYIEQELAWSNESFLYLHILKIEEVQK